MSAESDRGKKRRRRRGGGPARADDARNRDRYAMDEVLEALWMYEETHEGSAIPHAELSSRVEESDTEALLGHMADQDLLQQEDDGWRLEETGRTRAREVIRRHRLAERLFVDVLELEQELLESNACSLEHAISREVAEHICTLLGHPLSCPHGHPIPPGACCERFRTDSGPLVMPLARLPVGSLGRISYIASQSHARLDRLSSLGLVPGTTLRLHQCRPSFVIFAGETQIALDEETAQEIYVHPNPR
ncbi:metal-dependent transcriptional regulator [Planctomycetota bacterium]